MRDELDCDGNELSDTERLTRLGDVLRLIGLDELPEMWNILRGDMSIVGPRPTESVAQGAFWGQFRAHACTSFSGVPYAYQMLERIGFRDMELPSLTSMQQAGGALNLRLTTAYADYMAARRGQFLVMYGQTEATARMAYVPPEALSQRSGSAGRAISGGRLRIEAGQADPSGRNIGEVVYEGPNIMLGYATGVDDLAAGDELDGILHTGDTGYLDDDGYLYLVGRSKRIAKIYGLRLNLDEVEATLREHGPAAVVGGDEALWALCAFGTDRSVIELADGLERRYGISRNALLFRRVEEIPTAASGKIDYQQVKRWILPLTANPSHPTGAR